MNYTRKYYESFLDSFSAITKIELNNYSKLNRQKEILNTLISKTIQFDILNIELSKKIQSELKSKTNNKFIERQSRLAEFLYNNLGRLLYTFERTERTTDYATALEIYRTELPFQTVSKWNVLENESKEFSMDLLFFDMNRKWIAIDNESDYFDYKKEIANKNANLRYKAKDKKIQKKTLDKIQKHFQKKFDISLKYIESNYSTIKSEFSNYDSNIKMYVIDRNGAPGQTTKQTKTYKGLNPKNKCTIYPYLLNLATRFNNLEEIESNSLGFSESLFEIEDLEKYDSDFDLRCIYRSMVTPRTDLW